MKENVRFMLFTLLVVVIGAGLCFGQVTRKPQANPKPVIAQPAATDSVLAKYPNLQKVPFSFKDGLQCLLGQASAIDAAYAAAAASGCTKMSTGQGTAYACDSNTAWTACYAAEQKLQTIFKNCGLKEPGTAEFFGGAIATPGCNSLGIGCIQPPPK